MPVLQRQSPPVRYPLQRSRLLGGVFIGLALSSAAVLLAWGALGAGEGVERGLRVGLALAVWLVCTGGAGCAWQQQPLGVLYWSGLVWVWEYHGQTRALQGPPVVVLDMQAVLVLTFRDVQQRPWRVVLQRDWAPPAWMDLRRAVYSSAHLPPDASSPQAP